MTEKIDRYTQEYQKNKELIQSCIDAMFSYKKFMVLTEQSIQLIDKWENLEYTMDSYFEAEEYDTAAQKAAEIIKIMKEIQQTAQERQTIGIFNYSQQFLSSYEKFAEAYQSYYDHLLATDDREIENTFEEYRTKYAEAVEMNSNISVSGEILNDIDAWYQENIGICFTLFEDYSTG